MPHAWRWTGRLAGRPGIAARIPSPAQGPPWTGRGRPRSHGYLDALVVSVEQQVSSAVPQAQPLPSRASAPSLAATAAITKAASGSAQDQPSVTLMRRPASSAAEK